MTSLGLMNPAQLQPILLNILMQKNFSVHTMKFTEHLMVVSYVEQKGSL